MTATVHYHETTITLPAAFASKLGMKGDGEVIAEETEQGILLKSKDAKASIPPHPLPLEVRQEMFLKSCGMWKDRTDLPDFDKLRAEADRF